MDIVQFRESLGLLGALGDSPFTDLLFNAFSTGNRKVISFREYAIGLHTLTQGTEDEKLKFSFDMIDSERKGEISLDDFQLILNSTQRVVNSVDNLAHNGTRNIGIQPEAVKKLFEQMDVDKDNKVTFEEFKRCFKNLGLTNWMSHFSSEKGLLQDRDLAMQLPFYVHQQLSTSKKVASDLLNSLASMLEHVNRVCDRGNGVENDEDMRQVQELLGESISRQWTRWWWVRRRSRCRNPCAT
ncbi:uncharacterized protein [Blastocystis hominis]|uniref:EF-hand domain-containing protein n=1 Tax=Blastocystis hominis TaxID=12968 RepID=D8M397_BLAHO|nr:uncharacterized protein [Blastocystis hominis]CBK22370.2 unnamed protein product [Blastocystis hominis]|eukprot:XP_012896418.1 uncharacterized protein [Blastocystis hominis]